MASKDVAFARALVKIAERELNKHAVSRKTLTRLAENPRLLRQYIESASRNNSHYSPLNASTIQESIRETGRASKLFKRPSPGGWYKHPLFQSWLESPLAKNRSDIGMMRLSAKPMPHIKR